MKRIAAILLIALWSTQPSAGGTVDSIHELVYSRITPDGKRFTHEIDPPLFENTHYLLEGESNAKLIALLDTLASEDPQVTLPDPRARALAQHELWDLFDWTARNNRDHVSERIALRTRLARCILRLALNVEQIDALPSGFHRETGDGKAPPDLMDESTGWVSLGIAGSESVALAHRVQFGSRSAFGVFLKLPGGREATMEYLKQLANGSFTSTTQPSVPQFPVGTQVALMRRMMLIDQKRLPVCSPIIQSIQMRTFEKLEAPVRAEDVRTQQFVLDRAAYLATNDYALHTTSADEEELSHFFSFEIDPFERRQASTAPSTPYPVLASCVQCHNGTGIYSMHSFTRGFSGPPINPKLTDLSISREGQITSEAKQRDVTWGLLRGYWENEGR